MRRVAVDGRFVDEALALEDAETVLLVDGDEAEAGELDIVFDEGVSANYQVTFTAGDAFEGSFLFGGFHAADEVLDFVIAGLKDAFGREVVLDSKDFRGGHQRGLGFVFDRDDRGLQCDDGFSAADIALEQTIHGRWLFQIGCNFGQDSLLSIGGLEGEDAFEGVADVFFADEERDGFLFAGGAAFEGEAELEEEKFFEDEAALGGAAVSV